MSPIDFFRLVRRGWPVLLAFTIIGGVAGYGTTLRDTSDSTSIVETYWEARRTVVVDTVGVSRSDFELSQQALFATGGEVPASVASELGLDSAEMVRRLRSVTDVALGSITVVVVAETPEEADDVAALTAERFVTTIGERERAQFLNERTLAENEVTRLEQVLIDLDREIAEQEAKLAADEAAAALEAGETPSTTVPDEDKPGGGEVRDDEAGGADRPVDLRDLELQRESASQRYADAVDEVDRRNALPDPVSPLSVLSESAEPIEITESAFNQRIRAGESGQRNFLARDVSLETERVRPIGVTSTNVALRTLMGAVAGLLLGFVLSITRARLDPRVRTAEEAQLAFDAPVLAEIPAIARSQRKHISNHLTIEKQPLSESAEQFRRLRVELDAATDRQTLPRKRYFEPQAEVIVVVGTEPGDDAAIVASNLALAYVETGQNVVLFDMDHRRPAVHELFENPLDAGEFTRISEQLFLWSSMSDAPTPANILAHQRENLDAVRTDADIVIVSASSLIAISETLALMEPGELMLPVFRLGTTTIDAIDRMQTIANRNELLAPGLVVTESDGGGTSGSKRYFSHSSAANGHGSTNQETVARFSGFELGTPETAPRAAGTIENLVIDVTDQATASAEDAQLSDDVDGDPFGEGDDVEPGDVDAEAEVEDAKASR